MTKTVDENMKFRQMTVRDLDTFFEWLHDPLIIETWLLGKPPEYDEIKNKYIPRIEGKTPTTCYIITSDDHPVGYIQSYLWKDYPNDLSHLNLDEKDSASFDLFIGDSNFRGKNLGPIIVSNFLDNVLFKKYPVDLCIEAPLITNLRSIGMLEKAGFTRRRIAEFPDEPGPCLVMALRREKKPQIDRQQERSEQ